MINDEERKRAVAELREASTGAYRHVDSLDVIANSIGVEVDGKFIHEVENETYAALADLIDRPTYVPLKQLARAAGVNLSSLSHAISNGREVKMNLLLNLAEAMGEDPRDVVRKKVER